METDRALVFVARVWDVAGVTVGLGVESLMHNSRDWSVMTRMRGFNLTRELNRPPRSRSWAPEVKMGFSPGFRRGSL